MAHNTGTDRSGYKAVRQEATTLASAFDPAALEALQEAFEEAWSEVLANPIIRTNEQTVRNVIATRIVEAALEGERDPELLKAYALPGFALRQSA
jgi:hypothetical protein